MCMYIYFLPCMHKCFTLSLSPTPLTHIELIAAKPNFSFLKKRHKQTLRQTYDGHHILISVEHCSFSTNLCFFWDPRYVLIIFNSIRIVVLYIVCIYTCVYIYIYIQQLMKAHNLSKFTYFCNIGLCLFKKIVNIIRYGKMPEIGNYDTAKK